MSVPAAETQAPLLTPRVAITLVLVSVLTALAFLALTAFAPDLRSGRSSGATVISKSAVGFAALRLLLDDMGIETAVGREPPSATGGFSLVILTPEPSTAATELATLAGPGPRLVILPKWIVAPDPEHSDWVRKLETDAPGDIAAMIQTIAKGARLAQRASMQKVLLGGVYARFRSPPSTARIAIDRLQTISGPNLEPDLTDEHGNAVLVQVKGTEIYILADPDLLNDQGLAGLDAARIAYTLVQAVRVGNAPVSFDVTLNGFKRSPGLLRSVFSPPLLGATLCVLLAAGFLGFHAMSRFGSPPLPGRALAFGKRALADNTAEVIRMMHREPAMAARYAQAVLSQVALHFSLDREAVADPDMVSRIEQRGQAPFRYAELSAEACRASDTYALVDVATKLYRWKQAVTHGHR